MPEEMTTAVDSAPIHEAIAAFAAEVPDEAPAPEELIDAEVAQPAESEPTIEPPASDPPPMSRADKVRAEALRRKAEREAKMPVAEPPPRAPNPLEEYQAEEIRRSVEFARLFQRNPAEAAKRAGLDPLKVAQLFYKEGAQPGALAAEEQQNAVANELKATREEIAAWKREQQQQAAQAQAAAQARALVDEFKAIALDAEAYPLLNSELDEAELMEEAGIIEQRYRREHGDWPSMREVAELVEDKLEKRAQRRAGRQPNSASKGAANTQKVNQVTRGASRRTAGITNDLAAETAAPVELDMSDHAVMKRAEMALRRVGAE